MDDLNLEILAKEIVIDCLKGAVDAPAGAGELARQIITKAIAGTQPRQAPRAAVASACRGLMSGMLLLEKDLPRTAVAILSQMGTVAEETHQDPGDLMTWAMEGIAPIAQLAGSRACAAVQEAIEAAFMGAGRIFSRACAAPRA